MTYKTRKSSKIIHHQFIKNHHNSEPDSYFIKQLIEPKKTAASSDLLPVNSAFPMPILRVLDDPLASSVLVEAASLTIVELSTSSPPISLLLQSASFSILARTLCALSQSSASSAFLSELGIETRIGGREFIESSPSYIYAEYTSSEYYKYTVAAI